MYKIVALILLLAQAGCMTSQLVHAPATELATAQTKRIIVTQTDGSRFALTGAQVRSQTIFGMDAAGRDYELKLGEAEKIEVRKVSAFRTAALGVGIVAVLMGVKMAASGGKGDVKFVFSNCMKFPDSTACGP